jgi:hypothetical protein
VEELTIEVSSLDEKIETMQKEIDNYNSEVLFTENKK